MTIKNPTHKMWWKRHVLVIAFATAATMIFFLSRAEWSAMHRWNRAVGDVSLIFVATAMALGPLSRLRHKTTRFLPYRREFGIYAVLLALIHLLIILIGWINLDFMRLIGFEFHPGLQRYVMSQHGFGLANLVGVLALIYGAVLAITSNEFSIRVLGLYVWKFIQRGTYVLWWLSVVHVGYFLFMHFLHYHVQPRDPNWFKWPFVGLVGIVMFLQIAAFLTTWRRSLKRNRTFNKDY